MSVTCPRCSASSSEGTKVCQYCGHNFPQPAAAEAIARPQPRYANRGATRNEKVYSLRLDDLTTGYSKASVINRLVAHILDVIFTLIMLVPAGVMIFVSFAKLLQAKFEDAIWAWVIFSLLVFVPTVYASIKDGLGKGQSWGKQIMNLMVINIDTNAPCSKGESFVRNFVSWLITGIPYVGWVIEPLMLLIRPDGRKVGDLAARTQVIDVREYQE